MVIIRQSVLPLCLVTAVFLFTGALAPIVAAVEQESLSSTNTPITLAIGKVTSQPRKHYPRFRGMADFLEQNLKDLGVAGVDVLFARDNEEMLQFIKENKIDFISETMFSTMRYVDEADVEILVREWRNNVPEYHTVFFTSSDADIASLDDLKGATIAFEDPGSTSAYFLPVTIMKRHGLRMAEVGWPETEKQHCPQHLVCYVFAKTENNIPIWVDEGRVDAGVLSNTDWLDEEIVPAVLKSGLHIFKETEPVPRSLLSTRRDVSTEIKQRVREILLTQYGSGETKEIVKKFSKVTKYDLVPEEEVGRFMALYENLLTTEEQ